MKRGIWIGALLALSCQGTWQAVPAVPPAPVQPAPSATQPAYVPTPTPAPTATPAPAANTEEARRQCIVQCGEAEAICKEQCEDERCWGECSDQEWSCRRQC